MEGEILKQIIEIIKSRWYRKSTLIILVLLVAIFLLSVFSGINIDEVTPLEYGISAIVILGVTFFWFFSNRVPKTPKGKIGFAVGIITDDPVQQQKIKSDFIDALRKLLYQSKFKNSFVFIELPNRFVNDLNTPDAAIDAAQNLKCAFMLYGRARTTTEKGQVQHVLDLEGVVTHKPISTEISRSFSKEFSDLFPRRRLISSEGDLFEFEITATWIDLVSKYVVAMAALLSGDIDYSEELFEELYRSKSLSKPEIAALIKIKQRLPLRLSDIYLIKANVHYQKWSHNKSHADLLKIEEYLKKLEVFSPNNIEARYLRSIWYFLSERSTKKAKAEILKTRHVKHTAWQYNYAFLLAYDGNTQEASKEYSVAVKEVFAEPKVVLEILEFIVWVVEMEPEKVQLHYFLGYIYYHAIRDYVLALNCYEKFLEVTPKNRFPVQRKEAEKFVSQIKRDIKSGKIMIES